MADTKEISGINRLVRALALGNGRYDGSNSPGGGVSGATIHTMNLYHKVSPSTMVKAS